MNGLDTNILVRYLVQDSSHPDDITQSEIAFKLMQKPSYVSLTVVLE